MVKVLKRQDTSLQYLEEVRQHMARLPNIDPSERTLLICGFPNVGKSTFINLITNTKSEVQPYAFTTKSLIVGHTDYNSLPWQVIDTPGILDHAIDARNTIEMQSITALAHLRCSIIYMIDISESCGYSIQQQVSLFESICALFQNKPIVVVINKIDLRRPEDLNPEEAELIDGIFRNFPLAQRINMSSFSEEGVMTVKSKACEMLLELRTEMRMKGRKEEIRNRLHVSEPMKRDDKQREAYYPETLGHADGKVARRKLAEYENQQELYYNFDPEYHGQDWKRKLDFLLSN